MNKLEFERGVLELWNKSAIPLTRTNVQQHTGVSATAADRLLAELVIDGVVTRARGPDGELEWNVPGADRPSGGARNFQEFEMLRRLTREVQADAAADQTRATQARERAKAEADQLKQQHKQEQQRRQLAMVKAEERALEDLNESGDASDDETSDSERPGFLARLFGKRNFGAIDALAVASDARGQLEQPRAPKEKSLLWSAGLSLFLGPVGWLYAGSWRESIPAAVLYGGAAVVLSALPGPLVWPVMALAMPISALVGAGYAWQHNKKGHRVRLLTDPKKRKRKRKKLKSQS